MSTPSSGASAALSARKRARLADSSGEDFRAKRRDSSDRPLTTRTPSPSAALAMVSGGSGRKSGCVSCPVLQSELTALRAELDHASSLRLLERRRSDQAEARLRRQIQFLTEEADEARRLLDEMREKTEEDLARMAAARREALDLARNAERRLRRRGAGGSSDDEDENERPCPALEKERRKNRMLEERLGAMKAETEGLKSALEDAEQRAADSERRAARAEAELDKAEDGGPPCDGRSDDMDVKKEDEDNSVASGGREEAEADPGTTTPTRPQRSRRSSKKKTPLSPAPPAVMSELNRVRVQLAESERKGRQLARRLEMTQRVADEAVRHREAARLAESTSERLRNEMAVLTRDAERSEAERERWNTWTGDLRRRFHDVLNGEVGGDSAEGIEGGEAGAAPPEVTAVMRSFRSLEDKIRKLEDEGSSSRTQLEVSRRRAASLEQQLKTLNTSVERTFVEKKDLDIKAKAADAELRKVQAQEKIWRRENDSLRSLLETYDKTQEERWKGVGKKSSGSAAAVGISAPVAKEQGEGEGPTVQGLKLGLASARDQIRVLEEEVEETRSRAEAVQKQKADLKTEHDRVLEKFGKLREALYKEREKAEKAEEKAHRAEMLVGKGHFNDETTRALHLKENPLMTAVRDKFQSEITALKKALEEKEEELVSASGGVEGSDTRKNSSSSARGGKGAMSGIDAQKLHQRLKQSFKEQIGLFREGVYLLTGYKIDMAADSDRPKFTVRSMYSDKEEDHLLFVWPKTKKGEDKMAISSLDLMGTEMAQILAQSPSFDYMTKYKSMPAFMASVQLSLFEKTTFAG